MSAPEDNRPPAAEFPDEHCQPYKEFIGGHSIYLWKCNRAAAVHGACKFRNEVSEIKEICGHPALSRDQ